MLIRPHDSFRHVDFRIKVGTVERAASERLPLRLALVVDRSGSICTASLYDPRTNSWSATGTMSRGRFGHTATLLASGKVLVAGGTSCNDSACKGTATAELYDPRTGHWSQASEQEAAGKGTPGEMQRLERDWMAIKQERDELEDESRERRYTTQDPTVQKLGALLRENPRGLLLVRDELAGWLHSLEKPGNEGDRQFYLEAWNGTGGYYVDRVGRGTVHIPALTVSVLGGITPGKLNPYVAGAEAGDDRADGLLQRFQMLVWPDTLGEFHKPTRRPDREAREAVVAIFKSLDSVDKLLPPDVECDDDSGIPVLRFDDAAQELFDAWRAELEQRLRSGELRDAPAFEAHLSKYRSLMPSLALLFHLVEVAQEGYTGPTHLVGIAAARLAAGWCDFLEKHAAKVYHAEPRPGVAAARALAAKMEAGAITDGETVRDIYRHHWSGLTTAEQVTAGLAVLEAAHWVRVVDGGVSERGESCGARPAACRRRAVARVRRCRRAQGLGRAG